MPLSDTEAVSQANELLAIRGKERERLDNIHDYLTLDKRHTFRWLITTVPDEVKKLAQFSRVNMLRYVVKAAYQAMYVEGYRAPRADTNEAAWLIWQANKMDMRQIGVHKAALTYGKSYEVVLPGDTEVPVVRGHSPRAMTVAWGKDDEWPRFALEQGRDQSWRLYDDEAVYELKGDDLGASGPSAFAHVETLKHGVTWQGEPVCPVVRFSDTNDLDDPVIGLIEPLLDLQDQIDFTTFGLMVSQHYGAFKQRAIAGWLAETEEQKLRASMERLWTFSDNDIKFHEFAETNLKGYIDSRETTARYLSVISQTPAHELLGQLVNLSAEALAAADQSRQRANTEYRTVMGESHEQALALGGSLMGKAPNPAAEVRWRDTSTITLAQFVDALGKAASMLEIPPRALWDRFADKIGASQTEVDKWASMREEGDAFAALTQRLDRQALPAGAGPGAGQR